MVSATPVVDITGVVATRHQDSEITICSLLPWPAKIGRENSQEVKFFFPVTCFLHTGVYISHFFIV